MIDNPGGKWEDCAKHVQKNVSTVKYIVASDVFKDFFLRRKEEFRQRHDAALIARTTKVAEKALDLMLDKMEKQADKLPMQIVTEIASSTLDRLGYGPRSQPSVSVNIDNSQTKQVVMVPISATALEEARDALRIAEQQRAVQARQIEGEVVEELETESKPAAAGETRKDDLDDLIP
jgi:hypothetical protein